MISNGYDEMNYTKEYDPDYDKNFTVYLVSSGIDLIFTLPILLNLADKKWRIEYASQGFCPMDDGTLVACVDLL